MVETMKEQLHNRKQSLFLTPLRAMDEVLEQEYRKGEIGGIELYQNMPRLMLDDIEQQLKEDENGHQ